MKKTDEILLILLVIFTIGFSIYYFSSHISIDPLTGQVVKDVEGGNVSKIDDQEKLNPDKGVLKGKVLYTIKDSDVIINREPASNITVYFTSLGSTVADYAKVKLSNDNDKYKGELESIDADDSSTSCSSSNYETKENYYDINGNNAEDSGEFKVYTVNTDTNGCYAVKLPKGSFDIFI